MSESSGSGVMENWRVWHTRNDVLVLFVQEAWVERYRDALADLVEEVRTFTTEADYTVLKTVEDSLLKRPAARIRHSVVHAGHGRAFSASSAA